MELEALYMPLGELVRTMPDLEAQGGLSPETQAWVGRAYVLVKAAEVGLGDVTGFAVALNPCTSRSCATPQQERLRLLYTAH
jgi:hypothetical protein